MCVNLSKEKSHGLLPGHDSMQERNQEVTLPGVNEKETQNTQHNRLGVY